ncbi:MAG: transcription-repair coupling factor, partial [Nitrospinales bacterium]
VSWKRQKKKVKEALHEMAEELLKLYAAREISKGVAYSAHPVLMQEFADSFEYVETEDQFKAIEEVYENLENEKPMDRLICGDVGFGKTEVAMRAAFKVVLDKKQVAILVPTTILAQQHLNTFQERFRHYPVNIDMVSRFRSPKEQKKTLEKLKQGQVDIVIGTHRLLSQDVKFADLGLIIIDEEQRFGVKHKEKLKKLRATVDILTLTATPIPRTLHFSLMGVRDLSVIETPPCDRLAIKTYVRKFDETVIREAILRELDRGGQIYFVHNKVKSIHSMAQLIQNILPQVRIGIAHGQMPEKSLENVMKKFIDHEIDLLMCTSIIESGLDIPAANTIIINRADQFGLAQLYQLRGRVGRYKHQAFAYLMVPGMMAITPEARKRIAAIEELSELGAGFQLAARDMEIRGTGNLLGHNQSGHINAIGFDLYCKLIEDTVKEIKGEKVETRIEPEIDLQTKGYIPKDYIPDLNQRLEIYRRLHLMSDMESMKAIEDEMVDRFGRPPEPVEKLLLLLEIKILCQKLHISKARIQKDEVK